MMVTKFEKSELSICLADKMDKMDKTWKWLSNLLLRILNQKVIELTEHANRKVKIVMRIFCYFVYYLVFAIVAYISTRDQGDYYAESDLSNMETHAEPAFYYKIVWFYIVFFLLLMR